MIKDLDVSVLLRFHSTLYHHFGDPCWWPGETPMEIAIGAILTQNTSWSNVEKAIDNLRSNDLLDAGSLVEVKTEDLASIIRPAGYFNQKSSYLMEFARFVQRDLQSDIENLSPMDPDDARKALLDLKGIGKETADSILCYAAGFPRLVIDAYTFRVLERYLGPYAMIPSMKRGYDELGSYLMDILDGDNLFYNRFHALIVLLGKDICKMVPVCDRCPLLETCYHSCQISRSGEPVSIG